MTLLGAHSSLKQSLMLFNLIYECPLILKVPDDANKSLWLPKTDNGSSILAVKKRDTYATCEMYKDPKNHSLGTQPCVDGYEFHMDSNEWNVISEVKIACLTAIHYYLFLYSLYTTAF